MTTTIMPKEKCRLLAARAQEAKDALSFAKDVYRERCDELYAHVAAEMDKDALATIDTILGSYERGHELVWRAIAEHVEHLALVRANA